MSKSCKKEGKEGKYVNMVQKRRHLLWAKAHLKWTVSKWKGVLWSDDSKFDILFGNHGRLKRRETFHQISVQFKSQYLWWYGVHKCIRYGQLACFGRHCECWKVYMKVLEQHMLPSRWQLFQGRPCLFQQDNVKQHTAAITTAWLGSRRVRVLNWPACSPDLSPIENVWPIIKQKICQRRPQILKKLETYFRQKWD